MADIDISNPEDTDLVSAYPANERASRTATLALLSGTAFGGGTTGGSGNAQTLTISNTGLTLTTGLRGSFTAGFSVSSAAATLQINSLTATTMVCPNGGAIWATGDRVGVVAGNAYDFVYDGTDIVILNPSHYMDQGAYNCIYPLGTTYLNINATDPVLPLGVTATWTRLTTDQFLKIASGSPTAGGSGLTTSGESALHSHTFTPSVSTLSIGDITIGSGTTVVTGVTGGSTGTESASHTHTIDPLYRSFAVYFRAS